MLGRLGFYLTLDRANSMSPFRIESGSCQRPHTTSKNDGTYFEFICALFGEYTSIGTHLAGLVGRICSIVWTTVFPPRTYAEEMLSIFHERRDQ